MNFGHICSRKGWMSWEVAFAGQATASVARSFKSANRPGAASVAAGYLIAAPEARILDLQVQF
jgi:hypothetical protein